MKLFPSGSSHCIRRAGFTLVETLVSAALLSLVAGSSLWALSRANSFAAASRLSTGAQVAAQNEIDLIMSTGPFNPQRGQYGAQRPPQDGPGGSKINLPPVLTVGTTVARDVVIYTEPASKTEAARTIYGQMVTSVVATPLSVGGRTIYAHSATVAVTYKFRGRDYSVQLHTLRSSDVDGTT